MTIDKDLVIDLGDIKAVTLTCHTCEATLCLPPEGIQKNPPQTCPNCTANWFPDSTPDQKLLKDFLSLLRGLRERSGKKVCQVRLIMSQPD